MQNVEKKIQADNEGVTFLLQVILELDSAVLKIPKCKFLQTTNRNIILNCDQGYYFVHTRKYVNDYNFKQGDISGNNSRNYQ